MSASLAVSHLRLEPVGGVAGDMFAAAMLDAFPEALPRVMGDLAACGIPPGVTAGIQEAHSAGLRAARFQVTQDTTERPPRTLAAMARLLEGSALDDAVAARALAIFRLLAEAEAHVHGATVDTVHFHEVSDWDSLVDIVCGASLIHGVPGASWHLGALPLGGGTVHTAHGEIPVPAPATARLLTGFRWQDDGIGGERVTPTGAAILAHLAPSQDSAGTGPCTLQRVGVGCGTRELAGRANILRVSAFCAAGQGAGGDAGNSTGSDVVERIAFEVDDMTGEELAVALAHLRATPGVLDALQVPLFGKKGRSTTGLRLLVTPARAEAVMKACFLQTTTLGLRHQTLQRRTLRREQVDCAVDGVPIPGKRAHRPDSGSSVKVDSDALAQVATLAERRRLGRAAATAMEHAVPAAENGDD